MEKKRLTKSSKDKMLAGVCGGIAEHIGIDSTLIRIAFALLFLFEGVGLIFYIICAIIFPKDTGSDNEIYY